jgi:hypothetical protein
MTPIQYASKSYESNIAEARRRPLFFPPAKLDVCERATAASLGIALGAMCVIEGSINASVDCAQIPTALYNKGSEGVIEQVNKAYTHLKEGLFWGTFCAHDSANFLLSKNAIL